MYNLFSDLALIPKETGVYKLIINNNCYIGSSIDIKDRMRDHSSRLRRGVHSSTYLQNSFNKHGKNNLYVEILFTFINQPTKLELLQKEEYFIDMIKPKFNTKLKPTTQYNSKTQSKKCHQFDLNGVYLKTFLSSMDVKRQLNIDCAGACRGGAYKSAGGFLWSYKKYNKYPKKYINNSKISKIKSVTCYDISGLKIKSYASIAECCRELFGEIKFDCNCASISSCAKGKNVCFNGYRFSYENIVQLDNNALLKFKKGYPVKQLDENHNLIKLWDQNSSAEKELGLKVQLSEYVKKNKKHKGYYWVRL